MKYTLVVNGTISLGIEVEASSLDAAMEKARQCSVQSLCHQCSAASNHPNEWTTSGELDCDPSGSPLVDIYLEGASLSEEHKAFETARKKWGVG